MKKIKGALTTTERQVQKNRKTIAILILILVVSVVVNVIYITGMSDKLFPQKGVSEEIIKNNQISDADNVDEEGETSEDSSLPIDSTSDVAVDDGDWVDKKINENDTNAGSKNFDADEMLRSLYNSDNEEQYAALKENYEKAESYAVDFKDTYRVVIKYDKEKYEITSSGSYITFEANGKKGKFTKEKIEEIYTLIGKYELKKYTFFSYVNSSGMVIDVENPNRYISGYVDYDTCKFYPSQNMEEIVEYCRELKNIMLNN